MIGLRSHARDARLPALAGDHAVPGESEVLELVAPLAKAAPTAAEWVYARWKPRTALCTGYEVSFVDGTREFVTLKMHTGDKVRALAAHQSPTFRAYPERNLTVSLFPFDRMLPGLERCFDMRRVARHIDELGTYRPLRMRPGPSKLTVLRYKPERRAVLRLDLKLRERDDSPRVNAKLILRVHPPEVARHIAAQRTRFDAAVMGGLAPRLVGIEARTGTLFEEWLAVDAFAPDEFQHAELAGGLLAQLHATPCAGVSAHVEADSLEPWFSIDSGLARAAAHIRARANSARIAWIHGDFHSDQVANSRAGGGYRLLDLDRLAAGDPIEDLASWIADHVAQERIDWRDAARPLLAGYARAGGSAPSERELGLAVAIALAHLAAAGVRRLQADALGRARELVEIANAIAVPRAVAAVVHEEVERIDLTKSCAAVLTMRDGNTRRWVQRRGEQVRELAPFQDPDLPLSSFRDELEHGGRVDVLAYRPGRRLVLRFVPHVGERVILKGYRHGRLAQACRRHEIACDAAFGLRTRVSQVLDCDSRRNCLVATDLGGRPCDLATIEPARWAGFGRDLSRFQGFELPGDIATHDADAELAVLDELARRVFAHDGTELAGWSRVRAELASHASRLPAEPVVLTQRDLHDGQLLDLGDHFGWIDFDLLCGADAALDAANFVAHIELRALQGFITPARAYELSTAFLCGLARANDADCVARSTFYESATHLRLALVYHLRPRWARLSAVLVERAARAAARLRSA